MAFSSCFLTPSQTSLKINHSALACGPSGYVRIAQRSTFALKGTNTELFGQRFEGVGKLCSKWSSMGKSRAIFGPNHGRFMLRKKSPEICASWLTSAQIASNAFTLGTAAVLPFYTLMVVAPKAELTKKSMESSIPYTVLGMLYAYLLYLSWTPDTLRLMFASQYWLPELPGIAKMFSNEMTLASAWIHLLAVDLFAASRQVFDDGLKNNVETRHSVFLCLLFCPVGILTHFITTAVTTSVENSKHHIH